MRRRRPPRIAERRTRWPHRACLLTLVAVLTVFTGGCNRLAQLRFEHSHPSSVADEHPRPAFTQTVLPFTDLSGPEGLAVDAAGNVYVADSDNDRVVKLAPESGSQQVLGFAGLERPFAVAVGRAGTVYVIDRGERIVELVLPSNTARVVSFPHHEAPSGIAADSDGNLYVAQCLSHRVIKLPVGSDAEQVLGFVGLGCPGALAVDSTGTVYVVDQLTDRVETWSAPNGQRTLSFPDLFMPAAVAAAGDRVYVTQSFQHQGDQVMELELQSAQRRMLPITGLDGPSGVAVDSAGAVYVSDRGHNRVIKLARG